LIETQPLIDRLEQLIEKQQVGHQGAGIRRNLLNQRNICVGFYSLTFDEMDNVTKQRLRACRNKTQKFLSQPGGPVGDY
jgi:hypothetical protein